MHNVSKIYTCRFIRLKKRADFLYFFSIKQNIPPLNAVLSCGYGHNSKRGANATHGMPFFADFIDLIVKVQKRDNEKDRARGGKRCLGSGWGSF